MTPRFDKIHNRFKFNGLHFSHDELKEVAYSLIKEGKPYEQVTGDFLIDWLNDRDHLFVKTSGSTGKPKTIRLQKQAMVHSAIATGDFFGLKPGDTAIDCLPSHFIAGKMMLVRAMILGLEIDCVEPSAQPIFDPVKSYDFCAMIPLQLSNTIAYTNNIKTIIVGGAKVPLQLKSKMLESASRFFETYGMTETVTHVAIKTLESKSSTQPDDSFKALPNVTFSTDDRECLVIHAPNLIDEDLVTNDIVALKSDTEFEWLGRHDNVINSGGLKLFPERIEDKLQTVINERFIVASEPHETLGEQLILIVENPTVPLDTIKTNIGNLKTLDKHEHPKKLLSLNTFSETVNGKVQRQKTIAEALG